MKGAKRLENRRRTHETPCGWGCGRPAAQARPGAGNYPLTTTPIVLELCDPCASTYDIGAALLSAGVISSADIVAFTRASK